MKYLRVVNLKKYQHYKERRPPWVKLHRTVLSDYAFSRLQDASKSHLMLLWLLASEYDNKLPHDAEWLGRKIDAHSPVNIEELVSAGFLEAYEDASVMLAPCVQDESKRGSTENREQRTETATTPPAAAKGKAPPAVLLRSPDVEAILAHYRAVHPRKRPDEKARKAIVRALSRGYTPEEIREAIDGNAGDDWAKRTGNQGLPYLLRDNATTDKYRALGSAETPALFDYATGELTAYGERVTRPDAVSA